MSHTRPRRTCCRFIRPTRRSADRRLEEAMKTNEAQVGVGTLRQLVGRKCSVPGCSNREGEGTFRGCFCAPCAELIPSERKRRGSVKSVAALVWGLNDGYCGKSSKWMARRSKKAMKILRLMRQRRINTANHGTTHKAAVCSTSSDPQQYEVGTCVNCGGEMVFNVPRLGPNGGYVHRKTGRFECESNKSLSAHEPAAGDGYA